tara:strand:- start:431 stop:559 length:129 start_codon:yes stop_codon:yes gene_type:complete
MTLFAWIVIAGSFFASGWYARGLWDFYQLIDESKLDGKEKWD